LGTITCDYSSYLSSFGEGRRVFSPLRNLAGQSFIRRIPHFLVSPPSLTESTLMDVVSLFPQSKFPPSLPFLGPSERQLNRPSGGPHNCRGLLVSESSSRFSHPGFQCTGVRHSPLIPFFPSFSCDLFFSCAAGISTAISSQPVCSPVVFLFSPPSLRPGEDSRVFPRQSPVLFYLFSLCVAGCAPFTQLQSSLFFFPFRCSPILHRSFRVREASLLPPEFNSFTVLYVFRVFLACSPHLLLFFSHEVHALFVPPLVFFFLYCSSPGTGPVLACVPAFPWSLFLATPPCWLQASSGSPSPPSYE